jgi:thiamine transport system permease protein
MLTAGERRRGLAYGTAVLCAVAFFVATAVSALLLWDAGTTEALLFTPYTLGVLRFTLLQAGLSTLLSVLLAVPVALALARQPHFPGRLWILRLMALPMGLPVLIGALGLLGVWGRQGLINQILLAAGRSEPVSIYGLSGILLAHVFFNMPLAARLLLAALERLPTEYWLLSTGLGMRRLALFRFVEGPALRQVAPGIAGLIFMLCATSFTLVLLLGGGPAATTLEVAIYQSLRFDFEPPRAIALAFLQIGVTALILVLISRLPAPEEPGVNAGRALQRPDGTHWAARLSDSLVILAVALFLLLPLASIAVAGFRADLWSLTASPVFLHALWTSAKIAAMAAFLSVGATMAILAGQDAVSDMKRPPLLARTLSTGLSGMSALVLLVPPVVLGTGWFLVLRPWGEVAPFAPALVALINALMALPFVMRVLAPAVATHRKRTARLAASLGLSGLSPPCPSRLPCRWATSEPSPCSAPPNSPPCHGWSIAGLRATGATTPMD